jgi:hypothetical protein
MPDQDFQKQSLIVSGGPYEQVTCPFSHGNWKKAGDALVFIMLFVTAVLVLIALLMNGL